VLAFLFIVSLLSHPASFISSRWTKGRFFLGADVGDDKESGSGDTVDGESSSGGGGGAAATGRNRPAVPVPSSLGSIPRAPK
jgi:hypothetical protein